MLRLVSQNTCPWKTGGKLHVTSGIDLMKTERSEFVCHVVHGNLLYMNIYCFMKFWNYLLLSYLTSIFGGYLYAIIVRAHDGLYGGRNIVPLILNLVNRRTT